MQSESTLKKEFLKKWLMGLQKWTSLKEEMSLIQRKKAIKVSADLAMASTRNVKRSWSHALIAKATRGQETGSLTNRILNSDPNQSNLSPQWGSINVVTTTTTTTSTHNIIRNHINSTMKHVTRKIHKGRKFGPRKLGALSSNSHKVRAMSIMKRLVKKRTQILKGLVPGGEDMDEYSLIKEALDYIVSLRAQVDVMHHVASSSQIIHSQNVQFIP